MHGPSDIEELVAQALTQSVFVSKPTSELDGLAAAAASQKSEPASEKEVPPTSRPMPLLQL